MMEKRLVIALGGNAILSDDPSAKAQQFAINKTAKYLTDFIKEGYQLIVSHGNGPQVGNLLLQQAAAVSEKNPAMPLDTCVAMTEGSIGYWLQNALQNQLKKQGVKKEVISVVTQVIVSEQDPAFQKPTKPVGPFLSKEEAKNEMENTSATFVEDAGRGWRKVVPSPKPQGIEEAGAIKKMIEENIVTICAGGGGVSVIETNQGLQGVEAVIDKDFASEKLAELVDADLFIILTGVDYVYVNFNQPNQKELHQVSTAELKQYVLENQFAPGSMLPKIEAAIAFVEQRPQAKAVITSLENLNQLLKGNSGTIIYKE